MNFTGLAAKAWDPSGGGDPQWDHDFFRRIIEENPGPALDVGCGTGRLLIRYLLAGLDVEGVDTSADMLAICREKAASQGLKPVLYQQGMQELNLPRKYKTIFIPCGTFVLITDRNQALETLRRFHHHLLPGGILALSLFSPFARGEPLSDDLNGADGEWGEWVRSTLPDGTEIVQHIFREGIDPVEQLLTAKRRYQWLDDGRLVKEEVFQADERWWYKYEMLLALEKVGFKEIVIKGDYTEADFTSQHKMMAFLAGK